MPEGMILTEGDVRKLRSQTVSTTATGEASASDKHQQVVVVGDPTTSARMQAVDVNMRAQVMSAPFAATHLTNVGTVGLAVTLTLTAPAAGVFHYLDTFQVEGFLVSDLAAVSGSAAPLLVTTTNLPGAPVLALPSRGLAGDIIRAELTAPATSLKASVAATATTFVAPATPGVIWRMRALYFTGS